MDKKLYQIDSKTGEIIDGFVAYVAPKRQNGFGKDWIAMSQHPMAILAASDLTGYDHKVFLKLASRLDFENLLVVNQTELAKEIGLDRQHFNRSVKKLIAINVLLEGPRIGINRSYRLNPNFGWKGSAKNHQKALQEDMKRRIKAAGIKGVYENGEPLELDIDNQIDLEDYLK
ncbi:replication/maintenance protein RepL [Bartonella schoenbuchensis]|uniref:Replication protein RepA n=1 Tax=Bartonella schoenbuchensis m07a TaxID=1094496 RepID=N6UI13_9HYPH|nr:replication/maintenance protein RepL [Bartonella schoenbuchensis]ENN89888.1 replication protein RepA [Bartonella schoenbuchensis m07a]